MEQIRWLTIADVAESKEYGWSKTTQHTFRTKQGMPYSKVSHFIRYDRIKLDKWIEDHQVN